MGNIGKKIMGWKTYSQNLIKEVEALKETNVPQEAKNFNIDFVYRWKDIVTFVKWGYESIEITGKPDSILPIDNTINVIDDQEWS